jgi:hypothetical protein
MTTPPYAYPHWFLGLDLAQSHDASALATLELSWCFTGQDRVTYENTFEPTLHLCGLCRFPQGTDYTKYPAITAAHIARLRPGATPVHLVIDAGGPGAPVVDDIRRANISANITPMYITGGDAPGHTPNGYRTVPRRELISNMVLLIEHNVLRWAESLPFRAALEHELLHLNARTTHPDQAAAHDDLVMAIAIAAWHAKIVSPRILQGPPGDSRRRWTPQGPLF